MSFDKIVEGLIKEAQERGKFDNLPGKGRPLDLTSYFETPEDVRLAQSVVKNAGMRSPQVELLKDIAGFRQLLANITDERKKKEIQKQMQEKQIEFNIRIENQKRKRMKSKQKKAFLVPNCVKFLLKMSVSALQITLPLLYS